MVVRSGLVVRLLAAGAVHRARFSVGAPHRAVGRRGRLMTPLLDVPVRGTAIAPRERRQRRRLEHQPGDGQNASVTAEPCHESINQLN